MSDSDPAVTRDQPDEQPPDWRGCGLVAVDGEAVGPIREMYLDVTTDRPKWAVVDAGAEPEAHRFVPLGEATRRGEVVVVPHTRRQVLDAPRLPVDDRLAEPEERLLYDHYEAAPAQGAPVDEAAAVGAPPAQDQPEAAMTRSEEELVVSTRKEPIGRARLRKTVVTEEVTVTVPVRREEVWLEQMPASDADQVEALDEPEMDTDPDVTLYELTLYEEVPVVEKRVVPREHVRLVKTFTTEELPVSDELRKERVELDDESPPL
ncbi:MAG: YsnF/AvaK domain-containing protein [Actinomycetota bacterium]|nr:YsnF/AvaK domain-containing protein [Actinomycetota bacterium]